MIGLLALMSATTIVRAAADLPRVGLQHAPPAPAAPPRRPRRRPPDETLRHLPGSSGAFTLAQIRDGFGPADWYPGRSSARCRKSWRTAASRTCAPAASVTTRTARAGRKTPASPACPYSYFMQTMADFKSDARKSADSRKANTNVMIAIAKGMTDEETKAAAEYFGSMKWTPWIKVVEAEHGAEDADRRRHVPQDRGQRDRADRPAHHRSAGRHRAHRGAARSALGLHRLCAGRQHQEGRDAGTTGGGGKTTQCSVCHGAGSQGLGPVPGIAGRSPSYTVRQLYDMQQGTRKGVWSDLMKPVVAKLTNDDMLALAAYTASRTP